MEGESPATQEQQSSAANSPKINPTDQRAPEYKMGTRIGEYFQSPPPEQATAADLRELLLRSRLRKQSTEALVQTASVEVTNEDTSSMLVDGQDRVEELQDEEQQVSSGPPGAAPPPQQESSPAMTHPRGSGQAQPPAEDLRAGGGSPAPPPPLQDPTPTTTPLRGSGQARPSAADFMIEVVETPLMITERGERQAQGPAWGATVGNPTEVPD